MCSFAGGTSYIDLFAAHMALIVSGAHACIHDLGRLNFIAQPMDVYNSNQGIKVVPYTSTSTSLTMCTSVSVDIGRLVPNTVVYLQPLQEP